MSKRPARSLAAALAAALVAAALAAIAGATGAVAVATWTVRPGGTTSLASMLFTVTDTQTGTPIACVSSSAGGALKSGSGHSGTMTGSISHFYLTVSDPQCHAAVDGTRGTASDGIVRFSYANGTAQLKTLTSGGTLHFYDVHNCVGLLRNGDQATVSTTYAVTPKQAITSP